MAQVHGRIERAAPYYRIQKGVPAAVVRSYKEPLYDADDVLAATPALERELFQRPLGQTTAAGTVKTLLQTNMRNAGQLGTPLSFDVYGFNVRYPKDIVLADFRAITAAGVFQFIVGSDTFYLTVPIEDMPAGVDISGAGGTDFPVIGLGQTENYYRFDIGGQALHLNSTESFRVRYSFPSGVGTVTQNTLVRVYIRGILYKGV